MNERVGVMEQSESVDNNGSTITNHFKYYYHKGDKVPTVAVADMPEAYRRQDYLVHGRGTRKTAQAVNSLKGQLHNKTAHHRCYLGGARGRRQKTTGRSGMGRAGDRGNGSCKGPGPAVGQPKGGPYGADGAGGGAQGDDEATARSPGDYGKGVGGTIQVVVAH